MIPICPSSFKFHVFLFQSPTIEASHLHRSNPPSVLVVLGIHLKHPTCWSTKPKFVQLRQNTTEKYMFFTCCMCWAMNPRCWSINPTSCMFIDVFRFFLFLKVPSVLIYESQWILIFSPMNPNISLLLIPIASFPHSFVGPLRHN